MNMWKTESREKEQDLKVFLLFYWNMDWWHFTMLIILSAPFCLMDLFHVRIYCCLFRGSFLNWRPWSDVVSGHESMRWWIVCIDIDLTWWGQSEATALACLKAVDENCQVVECIMSRLLIGFGSVSSVTSHLQASHRAWCSRPNSASCVCCSVVTCCLWLVYGYCRHCY